MKPQVLVELEPRNAGCASASEPSMLYRTLSIKRNARLEWDWHTCVPSTYPLTILPGPGNLRPRCSRPSGRVAKVWELAVGHEAAISCVSYLLWESFRLLADCPAMQPPILWLVQHPRNCLNFVVKVPYHHGIAVRALWPRLCCKIPHHIHYPLRVRMGNAILGHAPSHRGFLHSLPRQTCRNIQAHLRAGMRSDFSLSTRWLKWVTDMQVSRSEQVKQ